MSNHPNRARRLDTPGRNPAPAEIAALRASTGLTQTEFGALLYASLRSVQEWESGGRRMPALVWEYANLLQGKEVVAARTRWLTFHNR